METKDSTYEDCHVEDVMLYIYELVKPLSNRLISYEKDIDQGRATYSHALQPIKPIEHNRIKVKAISCIEREGSAAQFPRGINPFDVLVIQGWQLQTNTVLIKAKFEPLMKKFVDSLWDDLFLRFGKDPEPERANAIKEPPHNDTYKILKPVLEAMEKNKDDRAQYVIDYYIKEFTAGQIAEKWDENRKEGDDKKITERYVFKYFQQVKTDYSKVLHLKKWPKKNKMRRV